MRWPLKTLLLPLLALAGAAGLAYHWLHAPLAVSGGAQAVAEVAVEPGTPPRQVAQQIAQAGVDVNPDLLYAWFKWSGQARLIKAGSYEFDATSTPIGILGKLTRGDETLRSLVLVEGWNWRQVRQALQREDSLRHDSATLGDAELMQRLGKPGASPEGRFFPDTYTFSKHSSDLALLRRALHAMDAQLQAAWQARARDSVLRSADEALILASIVEKETGHSRDRAQIAAVFHNRLRIGMPLQTDPTVIYGLGEAFDGNLRKRDLQTDTAWNTYTRRGLPPTPIAMPGKPALFAAVQPAHSQALYFVARGDGSSQFSDDLAAHNRAVKQYQLGAPRSPDTARP